MRFFKFGNVNLFFHIMLVCWEKERVSYKNESNYGGEKK